MSEILNEFIIQSTPATIVVDNNTLAVTPDAIALNVYTGAAPVAGGANTNIQFNNNGQLDGSNSLAYNSVTEVTTIGNLTISNVANLGGTSNVKISGGTNGYFLQTDGTGNLTWAVLPGNIAGNSSPGGANTEIQFNDGGNVFGGSAGFTFDKSSNTVNMPGDLVVAGNISAVNFTGSANTANYANYAGYVVNGSQPNITVVGQLANLSVSGTIAGDFINMTGNITSNANIIANGAFIGNLYGHANTASTVTTNAQPNITSVGSLTSLTMAGNINAAGQTITANVVQANAITGNLTFTDLTIAGNLIAEKVTSNSTVQGTQLISNIATGTPPLVVTSTTLVPNLKVADANYSSFANTVIGASQSNITSLGALTSLSVQSNNIALGFSASSNAQSIAIGRYANTNTWGIAIGSNTKANAEGIALGSHAIGFTRSVAIGYYANTSDSYSVAIGALTKAGGYGIAIGDQAGNRQEEGVHMGAGAGGINSIAAQGSIGIGKAAGAEQQDDYAIAIGYGAGQGWQSANAIAIGRSAGANTQGIYSIAIGTNAGYSNAQANNSIILNATGANLDNTTANSLVVKPIRSAANTNVLMYNTTSGEITYETLGAYTGYIKTISTTVGALTAANTAGAGARAFVTDANLIAVGNFGNIVGSGGSNSVPVYSDGTDWRIG